jgi:hypothetical protein
MMPHQGNEILRRRENSEVVRKIAQSYNVYNSMISRWQNKEVSAHD